MEFVFGVLFMVFLAVLILPDTLGAMCEDWKARNGVNNMDSFGQSYCYVTDMDKKSIIERLSIRSGYDKLEYTFDPTNLIITFISFNMKTEYQLRFIEMPDHTYVEASRMHFFSAERSSVYKVNPFFVTKLNATPVPYSAYEKMKMSMKE